MRNVSSSNSTELGFGLSALQPTQPTRITEHPIATSEATRTIESHTPSDSKPPNNDAFLPDTDRDRQVAIGIQAGLPQIGRRLGLPAVRAFRDDTNLAVSPDLWGTAPKNSAKRRAVRRMCVMLSALAISLLACSTPTTPSARGFAYEVTTGRISAHVGVVAGRLGPVQLRDNASGHAVTLREPFLIGMQNGTEISASTLRVTKPLSEENSTGKRICADLASDVLRAGLHWCLLTREQAGYVRLQLTISAASTDLPITEVRMLDFSDAGARVEGTVKGSPVVDGVMYFGFEHPLSWAKLNAGRVTAGITRQLPLRAGQSATYSSVVGVAAPGQMRREFLAYLEAERPRRYEPFLHYNSWFDLGFGNRYDEAGALDRIHAFAD